GLKNIELIERENMAGNAKEMEKHLKEGLAYLEEKHLIVTNSRSLGLLAAFELYEDPENNKMFGENVFPANGIVDECFDRQLILRGAGTHNHVVAIAPPLTITKEEIDKMINIIDEAITAFRKKL